MMMTDEQYMQRCFQLAEIGIGYAAPNPLVGSVVVCNEKIIGEGYHEQYGQAHAEVNAIASVTNKELLKKSTIYVNLEPCAHFGKTPPCSDLIIKSGIPRVVIGCVDSYSEVAGKGIEKMKAAGIDVKVGVLEKEALHLNRRFFTFHTHKRPYVVLKWAQSVDGYMDALRKPNEKGIFWITQPETKALVHKWRHEEAGILVGRQTVATDNPSLTCRNYKGQSPVRFVIDQYLKLDYGAFHVGDRSVQTYILTEKNIISKGNLQFIQPSNFSPEGILNCLYELNIQSVIIEGGKATLQHFLSSNIWDECRILTGSNRLGEGLKAPEVNKTEQKRFYYGNDLINIIFNA